MKRLFFLSFLFLIILSGCSFFNKITPAEFYQQKLEISLKKDFIDLGVISTTNVCNTTIDIQKNDSGKQVDFTINTNSNWIVIAEKNKSFTANNTFVGLTINPTVLTSGEYIGTVDLDFKYNGTSFVKKQVKIKIIITDKPFINPDKNNINWAYIKKDEITMDKIILSNPSQYSYNWEVQADVNWLSFASQSGTVNTNQTNELVVNINTNDLNYGTYTGKITISSNTENIYEKTKIIDVSITVSPPVLYTNTDVIDFGLIGIAETKTLTFTLSNPGSGTIDWTANDDTKFITLSKTNGTLDKNIEQITVTLDTTDFNTNSLISGTITITTTNPEVTVKTKKIIIKFNCDTNVLVKDLWKKGSITGSERTQWFYINGIKDVEYKIEWSESLDIEVSAYRENKTTSYFTNIDYSFKTIIALETEKIYIKIQAYSSGNTGSFTIKYSYLESRTPIQLTTNDTYIEGDATDDDIRWYYINGVKGQKYDILWKDYNNGSAYTGYVNISAYREDKTTSYFTNYNYYYYYTITAAETEKIYLKVTAPSRKGTFAIKFCDETPSELINYLSKEGYISYEITSKWYYINTTKGENYKIECIPNISLYLSTYREDKSTSYFTNTYIYSSTTKTITALETEKIYIKVTPYSSGNTGTFKIKYSQVKDKTPIELTGNDIYLSGDVTNDDKSWYYFNAVKDQKYGIVWKKYGTIGYTGNIQVSAYREDKATSYFIDVDSFYSIPQTITALAFEKVYLKVSAPNIKGTFAIKYYYNVPQVLTNLTYKEGNISSGIPTRWYYINATKGSEYKIECSNMAIYLSAYREDKSTSYFVNSYTYSSVTKTITALETEKIYIKVDSYSGGTGSFNIKYTAIKHSTPVEIINDTYTVGDVSGDEVDWYSFNATTGEDYYIYWNESGTGTDSYTGDVIVNAYKEDKTTSYFTDRDTGFRLPKLINATETGTIYLKVTPTTKGTYAIKFYNNAKLLLTNDTYKEESISNIITTKWFYFNATKGSIYQIYWDDYYDGSYKYISDIKVSAYREDKTTTYFSNIDKGYTTPQTITALETEKIYIKVDSNSNRTGNFAVKYVNVP